MCAPRLAKPVPLQTNSGDTSSARKARRTVIKDEHRAKAAQRHEVYQERTNKQNDQLKTIKVMKRRNSYIASTLVLALVLMVGFPTSATPGLERFYQGCGEKAQLACQDLGNRLGRGTKGGRVCEKAY